MSDDENIINPITRKSKNKLWYIISTIIKSLIVLLIIGFIMLWISAEGAEVYIKDASNRNYTGGWLYHEYLNPVYGFIGIIIYILINYFGFLSYNILDGVSDLCLFLRISIPILLAHDWLQKRPLP